MNFNRRRGAIAFFITLGVLLTGTAIFLNISWIILNETRVLYAVLGVILFAILIAGLVLNTIFLVREVRRNERQDTFLNAVTHELKTPIASIRLYLDTLQRRNVPEEQRQKFYATMHADSDRLLATVEQVLKAGELGQRHRQQNRTVIDLAPLVAECISITLDRYHLPAQAITLAPIPGQVRLRISGIAEDIRTAVLNLLDNAVKYSPAPLTSAAPASPASAIQSAGAPAQPAPRITCSLAITDYRFVSLSITDQGLGIPPAELKRIFKRFYRIPGRYEIRIKGTGLGLFLVRTIARQHGGSVAAASPGSHRGTTMTLTLPLASG